MPYAVIDAYDISSHTLSDNEDVVVTQNGFINSYSGTTITATNTFGTGNLSVFGTILNHGNNTGRILNFSGDEFNVFVGETGTLAAVGTNGIGLALNVEETSNITNHGTISADGNALSLSQGSGASQFVVNTGTITGDIGIFQSVHGGAYTRNDGLINATSNAFRIIAETGSLTQIANTGTIQSTSQAIYFDAFANAHVHFHLMNTGTIAAENRGIQLSGTQYTGSIINAGRIVTQGFAIWGEGGRDVIENSGEIVGDLTLGGGDDKITNTGLIQGNIFMGDGHDRVDTRGGTITGLVSGGTGNDVYIIDSPMPYLSEGLNGGTDYVYSLASSHVLTANFENLTLLDSDDINGFGNSMANTLTGNDGNNRIGGRGGNDTIAGGGGADTLLGGTGNDSVNGEDGNDRISLGIGNDEGNGGNGDDFVQGMWGNDLVTGGNGADTLLGNQGNDSLRGGNGDDLLIGGNGQDMMAGGAGADVFLFRSQGDSKIGSHDRIYDFDVTEDRLDLSPLGIQDVNLLSTFSHGGAPSVRTTEVGGSTQIFIDLDGLGGADMRIDLSGTTGLGVEDFIL
ncbi:M10 family metallopeptidase C-terminal domain-containing protein [Shimia sp. MIT1388]|uniref:M10 family metallopeptidase C-terminal domain-containing protein n=1 Tax=Shimia sp. MIT1388 TaxID=3096992 RepID=UPI00399B4080